MAETGEPAAGADPPAAHRDPAAPPPCRARAWRESARVVLLLTALAALLTWPAAAHLGSVATDLGDPLLTAWILAWDVHALTVAPLRFFDANMFHPHRGTLAYTEHLVGLLPFAGPARLAGAGVLVAHNLVWLATFPLTGLTMFWLVRHLTGHAGAATVAALLYAFSHFRFGQLGHVQMLSHQWLPLLLLGLHRAARDGGRWRDVWLAAVALTFQALSSGYQAFLAAIAGVVFAAWLGLPASRPPVGRLIVRGMLAGTLVLLVLLPFFLPYRSVRAETALVRGLDEIAQYAARPASYLATPAVNWWLGAATERFRSQEAILFPGLVALALALTGVVLTWHRPETAAGPPVARASRWPGPLDLALTAVILVTAVNWLLVGGFSLRLGPFRLSQRHFAWPFLGLGIALAARRVAQGVPWPIRGLGWLRRLGWPNAPGLYVGLTVVGVIASFGPRLELGRKLSVQPLYAQLYNVVPGFDALRVPGRFGVLVTTGLAVLAGFGAAALARRIRRPGRRALALGILGTLAVLETWAVPLPLMSVSPDPGPADRWLAAQSGQGAVVILPMYEPHAVHLESVRLLGSTAHWRPLVNGYGGVFPPGYALDVATLNTFPAPAAVARLRAIHVRYAVVYLGQYQEELRARLEAALDLLPPGVRRVTAFEHTQIFEIGSEAARASVDASGADEGPGALEHGRIHQASLVERVEARGDRQHGVELIPLRGEALAPALLAVDQDDEILHHEAGGLERRDRLELRRPVGHDVVDHDDALARLERALDAPPRAVRLLLAAGIDERQAARQARGDRQRQAGVRDARDPVGAVAGDLGREKPADLGQHVRMRDHHAQVDVEGRGDPRLQHELSEAHAADLVQPPHERHLAGLAHAGTSARIAVAAAAGSTASVMGRPTTR